MMFCFNSHSESESSGDDERYRENNPQFMQYIDYNKHCPDDIVEYVKNNDYIDVIEFHLQKFCNGIYASWMTDFIYNLNIIHQWNNENLKIILTGIDRRKPNKLYGYPIFLDKKHRYLYRCVFDIKDYEAFYASFDQKPPFDPQVPTEEFKSIIHNFKTKLSKEYPNIVVDSTDCGPIGTNFWTSSLEDEQSDTNLLQEKIKKIWESVKGKEIIYDINFTKDRSCRLKSIFNQRIQFITPSSEKRTQETDLIYDRLYYLNVTLYNLFSIYCIYNHKQEMKASLTCDYIIKEVDYGKTYEDIDEYKYIFRNNQQKIEKEEIVNIYYNKTQNKYSQCKKLYIKDDEKENFDNYESIWYSLLSDFSKNHHRFCNTINYVAIYFKYVKMYLLARSHYAYHISNVKSTEIVHIKKKSGVIDRTTHIIEKYWKKPKFNKLYV